MQPPPSRTTRDALGDRAPAVDAPDKDNVAAQIRDEQISLLFKPASQLPVNAINAAIVAAIAWPIVPTSWLVGWVAAMALTVGARFLLCRSFRLQPSRRSMAVWARLYALGAGFTGLLWGAMAVVIPMTDDFFYHMLIGLTATGMAAGGVSTLSVYLPAFYAFLGPVVVPVAAGFLLMGDAPHFGVGLMALIFAFAMILVGRGFNQTLTETLQLRFQNSALVRELSTARDMAEQAMKSNWETLAHLSHELRTPLNAIGGFADVMARQMFGPLGNPKYEEYAKDIGDSTAHLTSLVEGIILYSRGQTGALQIDEAVIDTTEEIKSCVQMLAQAARNADVELSCRIASDLPAMLADPVKLRQVLLNLLSNAIQFTKPGGRVTLAAELDDALGVVLTVSDTGIGIDAADLPRVMEPYVQLESALVRKRRTGLGLGLPIVKRLVELHGGTITLDSVLGVGTTATVRFPPERSVIDDRTIQGKLAD